jgi:RNA recognition motif-containing protein
MQAELEKYGEITMVNLQFDADGAARCFGFVNFATPEGAQAAKEAMDARQVHMKSSDGKSSGWWVKADWAKCDASGLHKSRQQKGRGNKPRLPVNEDGATPTEDQPAEDQQPRRPGDEVGFAPLVDKERMRAVDQARPDARAAGEVTSEYFPPPPPPTSKENGEVAEPAEAPPARTGDAGKDGKKLRSNRKPSGRRRRNSE